MSTYTSNGIAPVSSPPGGSEHKQNKGESANKCGVSRVEGAYCNGAGQYEYEGTPVSCELWNVWR